MEEPKISARPIAENRSSYRSWVASEGIPVIEGFFLEDIRKVLLEPWARTGGLACRICLAGTGETNDAYICEIPPGKAPNPQRHLFEELIYIVSRRICLHPSGPALRVSQGGAPEGRHYTVVRVLLRRHGIRYL